MAAEIKGIFREDLRELVLASKILVVGAGGIWLRSVEESRNVRL